VRLLLTPDFVGLASLGCRAIREVSGMDRNMGRRALDNGRISPGVRTKEQIRSSKPNCVFVSSLRVLTPGPEHSVSLGTNSSCRVTMAHGKASISTIDPVSGKRPQPRPLRLLLCSGTLGAVVALFKLLFPKKGDTYRDASSHLNPNKKFCDMLSLFTQPVQLVVQGTRQPHKEPLNLNNCPIKGLKDCLRNRMFHVMKAWKAIHAL
jgi:hypothetical protein